MTRKRRPSSLSSRFKTLKEFNTINVWQSNVENDDLGTCISDVATDFAALMNGQGTESRLFEQLDEHLAEMNFIVAYYYRFEIQSSALRHHITLLTL